MCFEKEGGAWESIKNIDVRGDFEDLMHNSQFMLFICQIWSLII